MGSVYQVAKIKSLSIYCNANCSEILLGTEKETKSGDDWIHSLQRTLETFKFNEKESLDFSKYNFYIRYQYNRTEITEETYHYFVKFRGIRDVIII